MKKSVFSVVIMFVLAFTVNAQNDTMYIMNRGVVVGKYNVNNQVDSVIVLDEPVITSSFTDSRDGHVYKAVTIGTQVWMAENLAYLPSVVGPDLVSSSTPYYYVYGYDGIDVNEAKATSNYKTYGVLYNWSAAMNGAASSNSNPSGVQGACPTGWHFPSEAEWTQLINYLGGVSLAGAALKEAGSAHWISPNTGATNESGFTALAGGYLSIHYKYDANGKLISYGSFFYDRYGSCWWGSTAMNSSDAIQVFMEYSHSWVSYAGEGRMLHGNYVRCVKD